MKIYAVLTGDIIGSSKLGPDGLEAAMSRLAGLASEFEQIHPGAVVGRAEVFRGDSWQLCLRRPSLVVTAAVFIRAGFKANEFDSRIGLGWGPVDRLDADRIRESSGPAFTRSGQALDGLGKDRLLAVASCDGAAPGPNDMLDAGVGLLDALISRWTQSESVAVYGALRKLSQEAIALLPQAQTKQGTAPSRQAIQDALRRISWASHVLPFLEEAEESMERHVGQ